MHDAGRGVIVHVNDNKPNSNQCIILLGGVQAK